jgi:bifunctional non-homologous end joining protein LigD
MARSILVPELPRFVPPMLAKPGAPFDSPEHLFEIKWDGTRVLAFVDSRGYRLINRHRADVTDRFPELGFLNDLPAGTVLDGEVVVLHQGKPDFGLLLSRNQARDSFKIQFLARILPVTYVVFDLLYDRYESLLAQPLVKRRNRLEKLIQGCAHPRLVFSQGVVGSGTAFFAEICRQGLEGMMAKRLVSGYRPGRRTDAWIRIKPKEGKRPIS